MVRVTGVKLELMTEVDMHIFIESAIRGVSVMPNRYAEANNPLISKWHYFILYTRF